MKEKKELINSLASMEKSLACSMCRLNRDHNLTPNQFENLVKEMMKKELVMKSILEDCKDQKVSETLLYVVDIETARLLTYNLDQPTLPFYFGEIRIKNADAPTGILIYKTFYILLISLIVR